MWINVLAEVLPHVYANVGYTHTCFRVARNHVTEVLDSWFSVISWRRLYKAIRLVDVPFDSSTERKSENILL